MSKDSDGYIHPHCLGCIKLKKCTARPEQGNSCEIVTCDLGCGFSFHSCKYKEHKLLCLNEKVPCYNVENGCPCTMQRKFLAKHLTFCPASVIHCTMEWNRWNIDPSCEKKLLRCTDVNRAEQPQLDVALALRDQRILRQWYDSNKNAQKVLRHYFKQHPPKLYVLDCKYYPYSQDEVVNLDASTSPKRSPREAPGLQNSVCSQLFPSYESYKNEFLSEISNGQLDHCESRKDHSRCSGEEDKENWINYLSNNCNRFGDIGQEPCNGSIENPECRTKKSDKIEPFMAPCDIDLNDNNNSNSKDESDIIPFDENVISAILSFPTRYLGLGPNSEPAEYSTNTTMYTFLCCQEFRRDEYPWHYKNVHSDIHAGLNGWLQERCPLAQYGCPFSRQRLHPKPKGARIVYSEVLESFGIAPLPFTSDTLQSLDDDCSVSHLKINISQLPVEVLQHIARFLDSFSLSNLSLTSTFMREVCRSLLVERGIVALLWEKQKRNDGKSNWKATQKRWFYSSHFTPVKEWIYDDLCSMANHLKTCVYFDRNRNMKPYLCPFGNPPNSTICKKLIDSIKDLSCADYMTTKL